MRFYIQVKINNLTWEKIHAIRMEFNNRLEAIQFCKNQTEFFNREIRLTDNEKNEGGTYFSPKQNEISPNALFLSNDREKDIQSLCVKVLNVYPHTHFNPNGADSTTCPFCYKRVDYTYADISDIKHSTDCAYNIAKDLSTGLR